MVLCANLANYNDSLKVLVIGWRSSLGLLFRVALPMALG